MTKKAYVAAAAAAGKAAFEAGRMAVPALDPAMGEIIHTYSTGQPVGYSLAALKAWSRAWHTANLAAPVTSEA